MFSRPYAETKCCQMRPGPAAYSVSRVNLNDPLSSLRIFINEPMLRNIRKCTEAETQRVTKKPKWTIRLDNLEKFIGLIIAQEQLVGDTCRSKHVG